MFKRPSDDCFILGLTLTYHRRSDIYRKLFTFSIDPQIICEYHRADKSSSKQDFFITTTRSILP